ncbi:hypothetical protein GYMLUDRAFT_65156 [Collybiopsis luxurians FD-317 M1]|uniref:Uncharacterized protein n=1 Tax=Collybiopsis luxurians FD-317 M1 TaxID=944289 RepID=A0A0D0BZC2_9AGAR|nr:hypothetical protein GYMLUDRAFT_65156 [Collybiopsis luxurians FD-317 M1]
MATTTTAAACKLPRKSIPKSPSKFWPPSTELTKKKSPVKTKSPAKQNTSILPAQKCTPQCCKQCVGCPLCVSVNCFHSKAYQDLLQELLHGSSSINNNLSGPFQTAQPMAMPANVQLGISNLAVQSSASNNIQTSSAQGLSFAACTRSSSLNPFCTPRLLLGRACPVSLHPVISLALEENIDPLIHQIGCEMEKMQRGQLLIRPFIDPAETSTYQDSSPNGSSSVATQQSTLAESISSQQSMPTITLVCYKQDHAMVAHSIHRYIQGAGQGILDWEVIHKCPLSNPIPTLVKTTHCVNSSALRQDAGFILQLSIPTATVYFNIFLLVASWMNLTRYFLTMYILLQHLASEVYQANLTIATTQAENDDLQAQQDAMEKELGHH